MNNIEISNLVGFIQRMGYSVKPTGSRFICNPPVLDTDIDYVIRRDVGDNQPMINYLLATGFEPGNGEGEDYPNDDFISLRKENLNFIIIPDEALFTLFLKATACAKRLNLLDKKDRINLFDEMMYGEV